MCGIFGVVNFRAKPDLAKGLAATQTLSHRGPDFQTCEEVNKNIIFGHTRLSIIDLSATSNQPFKIGNYTLVFNGEIFNYIELRQELISCGYQFKTDSDTEVLLNAYIHYGEKCVSKFNGMWAFVIHDGEKNITFASRDRYGVKPFVYYNKNGEFIFSSEVKAILKYKQEVFEPNYLQIANYVRNSTGAQTTDTWFSGINRLQAGHNLILSENNIRLYSYYQYPKGYNNLSFSDAKNQYLELFEQSVRLRMRSDVPVGTTLSSGIDSTSIVSVMRSFFGGAHTTYTACFEKNLASNKIYNGINEIKEEEFVKRLTCELNLDSRLIDIDNTSYLEKLDAIIYHLESGHSSPAIVPLDQLYARARQEVKVVLEGQGADELLGGYILSNFIDSLISDLSKGNLKATYRGYIEYTKSYKFSYASLMYFRQKLPTSLLNFYYKAIKITKLFGDNLNGKPIIKLSIVKPPEAYNSFRRGLHATFTGTLVDLLHYGDALSMKNSVEARVPFLDYNLVDFAFALPDNFKVKEGNGKYIHREAMNGILPEYIRSNKYKFGFNTPIIELFKKKHPENLVEYMLDANHPELFIKRELEKLIIEHNNGRDHSRLLFRILSTLLWINRDWS